MKKLYAIIMSSKFVNSGLIGNVKEFLYKKFISDRKESKTDKYRKTILTDFMDIYKNEEWILGFGSFLRYYRDSTMDGQDIDILMRYDTFCKGKEELIKRGYLLKAKFVDCDNNIVEYKLDYKGVEVDLIFMIYKNKNYYYVDSYVDEHNKENVIRNVNGNERLIYGKGYCSRWKKIENLEIKTYSYNGILFKSYKKAEENLTSLYGQWKIRDDNFDPMNKELYDTYIFKNNSKAIYYINSIKNY